MRAPRSLHALLRHGPVLLLAALWILFGLLNPAFLSLPQLRGLLMQSASATIVAVGMMLTLLVAGIDLAVGSTMFLAAVLAGKLLLGGGPMWLAAAVMLLTGSTVGAINGLLATRLRIPAFVVTLAMLLMLRGLGLQISQTRAMNLPDGILRLGEARCFGVPIPIVLMGLVVAAAHVFLNYTRLGRQLYAVGQDADAAERAGLPVARVLGWAYLLCGLAAGLGGLVELSQIGSVAPSFGDQREFAAIAAAVLGGTSLFGGRGQAFPGVLVGALLMQSIANGLVMLNVDPYFYPLVTAAVVFLAVLLDTRRQGWLRQLQRRTIRPSSPIKLVS